VDGLAQLVEMLAAAGDGAERPIPVAIETPRGLLVEALRASGRPVYPINPLAVARYRDRHTVSRTKSDHADAVVLANILRTDMHAHRSLPADTELARSIAVLARAHQNATWRRTNASNVLRSHLREYFPTFLEAVGGRTANLTSPDARAVLAIAPTPADTAKLSVTRIATALRQAGRQRGVDRVAVKLHSVLCRPQLRQASQVEQAMAAQTLALLATLDVECTSVERLGQATAEAFQRHPDHKVITSFPGLGDLTGARVLAELGDDRARFADARGQGLRRVRARDQSLRTKHVHHTSQVKNHRLSVAGFVWAFMAITNHPPARAHYDQRREKGDRHAAALRHRFNRLIGQLHHCLNTDQLYDQTKAFDAAPRATT
jgi:hypothetical protein